MDYAVLVLMLMGVAFGLGVYAAISFSRAKSIGALRVDVTDPDSGPYLFLELKNDAGDIASKRYVTMKVRIREDLSQK